MNFRIDMSHQEVLEYNKERNFHELLLKDEFRVLQTNKGMSNGCLVLLLAFIFYSPDDLIAEFKEAPIEFAPTYKFDLSSGDDVYAKHRTPAYTVRTKTENRKTRRN